MKILKQLNPKKMQSENKDLMMMSLEYLHDKKILNKVRIIMMRDIVNSMDIVSSDNGLIKAGYEVDGTIYLTTKVDGQEGYYGIFYVTIELVEHESTFVPKLVIKNTYLSETYHEYTLVELKLHDLITIVRTKIKGGTGVETSVLNKTQSERLDILDKVSDTMSQLQGEYRFRGYTKNRRRKGLL